MRRVVTNSKNKPTPASRFRVYTPPNEGVVNLNTDDVEFRGRVDFTNAEVVGIDSGVPDTYTLPATDGNAGQVLQTDGDGTVTWETPSGGSASYLVYTAILTQSGLDAPTVTAVLENTLGGTVVWARSNIGRYTATLAGAFPLNKAVGQIMPTTIGHGSPFYGIGRSSDNAMLMQCLDDFGGNFTEFGSTF